MFGTDCKGWAFTLQTYYRRSVEKWIVSGIFIYHNSVLSSVAQSCPTLCNPMSRSTPGLPVHHQLPESTQTHVHWVGDAIQPSHPLSSPFPPVLNLSQHQGLFQWVSSSQIRLPKYWSFSFNISLASVQNLTQRRLNKNYLPAKVLVSKSSVTGSVLLLSFYNKIL